jgi:hypothetical protein
MEALKAELQKLQAQRSTVEAEIKERSDRLNEPGQPGMSGSLLDKEVCISIAGQLCFLAHHWQGCKCLSASKSSF